MCGGFLRGCGWGASCHSASCAHPLCLVCATLGLHIGVRWISPRCDGIFGMPARTMCKGGWILPVPLGISVTFAPTMCWAGILIDAVGISVILVCRDGMGLCDSRPGLVRPSAGLASASARGADFDRGGRVGPPVGGALFPHWPAGLRPQWGMPGMSFAGGCCSLVDVVPPPFASLLSGESCVASLRAC